VSAAEAVALVLGADIPAGNLDALCRAVWRRIGEQMHLHNQAEPWVWPILNERLHRVRQGLSMTDQRPMPGARAQLLETFEADLRGLLAADLERFAYCVRNDATNVEGRSIVNEIALYAQIGAAAPFIERPRVQPLEFVQTLRGRGIVIAVDAAGDLHVTPGDMLRDEDRTVLVEHKAAFVEALSAPAVVL